ncbi:MAG: VIT1/CCC1 transporter family protein [Planctomycetota bacterium]|jgi:VIT1/CCC1 family predicted Fe2+/Mn2+ transporter
MHDDAEQDAAGTVGDMADHIVVARQCARRVLGGEAHVGNVDDVRQTLVRARDGVLLVWLVWIVLASFGVDAKMGAILVATGVGLSILQGLVAGVATRAQVDYYESELERERQEIKTMPEQERDEVRALYAAKGFRPPLLDNIVDTLCADDDRLLKVMMEEELGLFIHNVNHPVLVGLWSAGGGLAGTLAMALPVCILEAHTVRLWMPIGGAALLAILALLRGWGSRRVAPLLVSWLIIGGVSGALVHFLSGLLSGAS